MSCFASPGQSGGSRSSGAEARASHQPGSGASGTGRHVRSTGSACAIACAGGGKGLEDERLKVMVLQAVALHAHGEKFKAVQLLVDALTMAEPGGFIRIFVDEGIPMARLLSEAAAHGMMPDYLGKLLAEFEAEELKSEVKSDQRLAQPAKPLIEPLSERELEVLHLIAQGLSNREISERLFLALSTVKGHNRIIFDKLQVKRRTEAVARARKLGLL